MSAIPVDRGPPPNAGQEPSGQPTRNRNRRGRGRGRGQAPPRPGATDEGPNVASGPPAGGASNPRRNRGGQHRGRPAPSGGNPEHQLPPHMPPDALDDGASVAESTGSNAPRRRGRGNRGQGPPTGRSQPTRGGRRENFGARLTDGGGRADSAADESIPAPPPPTSGDLTSRLIYSLTHKEDAVDCPICFNPVHPSQPIWSCAPAPVNILEDPSAAPSTCCWTIFHMRCIRQWAQKSVVATREAYRARSVDLPGDWRCPGCQTKRTLVPQAYICFCARVVDPPPSRLSTPHSCGEPCVRVRRECEHACPMACHPGPCPPCLVSVSKSCWCGSKTLVSRCSVLNKGTSTNAGVGPVLSCGQPCGRLLGCEKHTCEQECHPGPCPPCDIVDVAKCYCGRQERGMACGTGVVENCVAEGEGSWEGRWQCDGICESLATLPRPRPPFVRFLRLSSPPVLVPKRLCPLHAMLAPTQSPPVRNHALDHTLLANMCVPSYAIPALVHHARSQLLSNADAEKQLPKCPVMKLRTAARFDARELASPLGAAAGMSATNGSHAVTITVCYRTIAALAPGACSLLLKSSFVLVTVLLSSLQYRAVHALTAPIPVHNHHRPAAIHALHIRATQPKKIALVPHALTSPTESAIAARVPYVTYDALKSGYRVVPPAESYSTVGTMHVIERVILASVALVNKYAGSQGKSAVILAPSLVMHLRPAPPPTLNLALSSLQYHALGISETSRAGSVNSVTWSPELIAFCRVTANQAFVKNVEKALADFVGSDKKAHVLPHMPEVRRKFVAEVAEVYRVNTQLVDEEPRRSVQLIRRSDSRIPTPMLSQAGAPAPSRLGSLGDLRKPSTVRPGLSSGSNAGAWRSVASNPAPASIGSSPNNLVSGSSILSRGTPMSGNTPSGSNTTPWTRSGVAPVARASAPAISTGSRAIPPPIGANNTGSVREDIPASWEDE